MHQSDLARLPPKSSHKLLLTILLSIALAIPGIIWLSSISQSNTLFSPNSPPGQNLYISAKLAGLYTGILATAQVLVGLLRHYFVRRSIAPWNEHLHRALGTLVCLTATIHVVLFASAKSIRSGHMPWDLLLLDFDGGFYRTAISIGTLGYYGIVFVLIAGVLRRTFTSKWRFIHKIAPYAVITGITHGLLIGSEVKSPILFVSYAAMILLIAIAVFFRYFQDLKFE